MKIWLWRNIFVTFGTIETGHILIFVKLQNTELAAFRKALADVQKLVVRDFLRIISINDLTFVQQMGLFHKFKTNFMEKRLLQLVGKIAKANKILMVSS